MNPRFEDAKFRNHVGLEMIDALRDVRSLSALRHCDLEEARVDVELDNVLSEMIQVSLLVVPHANKHFFHATHL